MKILLAVDGSPQSEHAAHAVAEGTWPAGTAVRVISAARGAELIGGVEGIGTAMVTEAQDAAHAEAKEIAQRAAELVGRAGLAVETTVRRGDARDAIVDEAGEWGSDLVILGSHGRTGLKRLVIGSVAEHVVRHAPCSVQVVRAPSAPERATRDVASLFAPPPRPGGAR